MKTSDQLQREFGTRLVTLRDGRAGLRGGIHCDVRVPTDLVPPLDGEYADMPMLDFIASDDTLDRYNEVINQDGWQLDNFLANPVVPDCHDYSSITRILGRDVLTKEQQVQGGKLRCRTLFAVDNPLGNLAYKMAKGGFIRSMSVGFIPLEWVSGDSKDKPDRTYTECELLEKSLVVVPANPGATVGLALKSGAVTRGELSDLADFLKSFCSEEKPGRERSGTSSACGNTRLIQLVRGLNSLLR